MSNETVTMLLEILKKLGCAETTIEAVKADPALKTEENPTEDKEETPEMEKEEDKSGVAVVVTKEEKPEEESPMKQLMKSMLKSKGL